MKEKNARSNALAEIVAKSIVIEGPIMVDHNGRKEIFNPKIDVPNGSFHFHDGVIAFIYNGMMYVIPYLESITNTLLENGFKDKPLYVPFTNGSYPVKFKEKWEKMLFKARKKQTVEFTKNCEYLCNELGYRPISKSALKNCICIPLSGLNFTNGRTFYPILTPSSDNDALISKLCTYSIKNNLYVFVYRDGFTYVTKNWDVLQEMIENGYRINNSLPLPFSDNEKILDSELAKKWAAIPR